MGKSKELSNSFSTGGGGVRFETNVQASFVVLMLTGGYAPVLSCGPIVKIKLQAKYDGFDTDDLVVFVENIENGQQHKILGQVKRSMGITKNKAFSEVIDAAWNDFNNPEVFNRKKDIIALITGPLNRVDQQNVSWLLEKARRTESVDEFLIKVNQEKYSPSKIIEKLEVIKDHIKKANGDEDVSNDELYDFLNKFYLLVYDLDTEFGVIRPLLHSHISQFQQQGSQFVYNTPRNSSSIFYILFPIYC